MDSLDQTELAVIKAALVREVMMLVQGRMDLKDNLDLKALLDSLEGLDLPAKMAAMDHLVSDAVLSKKHNVYFLRIYSLFPFSYAFSLYIVCVCVHVTFHIFSKRSVAYEVANYLNNCIADLIFFK